MIQDFHSDFYSVIFFPVPDNIDIWFIADKTSSNLDLTGQPHPAVKEIICSESFYFSDLIHMPGIHANQMICGVWSDECESTTKKEDVTCPHCKYLHDYFN